MRNDDNRSIDTVLHRRYRGWISSETIKCQSRYRWPSPHRDSALSGNLQQELFLLGFLTYDNDRERLRSCEKEETKLERFALDVGFFLG